MTPKRIQRLRTKGWRMPEGARYVGRPGKWGNPYAMVGFRDGVGDDAFKVWVPEDQHTQTFFARGDHSGPTPRDRASAFVVELFRTHWLPLADLGQLRAELAGKDLACWCPIGQPCHADELIKIANETRAGKQ